MTNPLISRHVLFGNPDKASVQISPDGAHISYLAPLDGILNVWVARRDDLAAARPVTHDSGRGIRSYQWAYNNTHLLYIQDKNGDENWRVYAVDFTSGVSRDLTPYDGVQARLLKADPRFPEEIILGLNHRDPQLHDLYQVNLVTGKMSLLLQNDGFLDFLITDDFQVHSGMRILPDGGLELLKPDIKGSWQAWDVIPAADLLTTNFVAFDKTASNLYIMDSRGRNTSALILQNLATGSKTLLGADPKADAQDVICHPTEKHVQAVSFNYERKRWQVLDPAIEPDLAYLHSVCPGDVEITGRSLDDRYWTVLFLVDNGPVRFYLYDRDHRQAQFLFTNRKELEGLPLVKMHSTVIKTSDGLDMVAYYSLPRDSDSNGDGIPDHPLPMVSIPHGGPWGATFGA